MPELVFENDSFIIDGEKQPLLMAELHYFRMPHEGWQTALDNVKRCGCNAVGFYAPWFVHEYEEGAFDFTGRINPQNDLVTWLELVNGSGLIAFLRPGPYIYAETTDLGIPKWFSVKYPEAQIHRQLGERTIPGSKVGCVSHMNCDFLSAVSRWYAAIADTIKPFLAPDGCVSMIQLCNEIPCDDHDDRNPENLGIGRHDGPFPRYLREKYGSVYELNQRYGARFDNLVDVHPSELELANPELYEDERLGYYYNFYYPKYFQQLRGMFLGRGVDSHFIHNAYNPRAISLHTENRIQNPWLNIGVDCYYSMAGQLDLRSGTYYCEFGAEYAKRFLNNVPWVIELECGYWHDYPPVHGPELYIWNIWTMAAGYQGMNMFLFASGINRPGMGFFGTAHNWQAPLDEYGQPARNFDDIRRSLKDIRLDQDVLLAPLHYDIHLGVKNQSGLIWKPISKASSDCFFLLKQAGFTPQMIDYERQTLQGIDVLLVVSDETMEEDVQRKLLTYVKDGGKLIIFGRMPDRSLNGLSSCYMASRLGLKADRTPIEPCEQEKLLFQGTEFYIGSRMQKLTCPEDVVIARNRDGEPAACILQCGKGSVLLLPFIVEPLFAATAEMFTQLLACIKACPSITGAKHLRVLPKMSGKCIVINPFPVPVNETVTIREEGFNLSLLPYSYQMIETHWQQ